MSAAVMTRPAPTASASPTTLSCQPFRFLRIDGRRERGEEETFGHHSPPVPPAPAEQREAAAVSAGPACSRSPHHHATQNEDSVPLDFSSRSSAPYGRRATCAASEVGVVDLCTRSSLADDRAEISTAAEDEERHDTSRESSSDGSGMFNASSDGTSYPYHTIRHPQSSQPSLQTYPIHPVALHPHHHQHPFILTPPAVPRQQSPPRSASPEGGSSATPLAPHPSSSFPGILSLTPPPPVPMHAPPLAGAVPHPLSPPQPPPQPPAFPSLLPAPLHKTLAVAAASSSKVEPGMKVTRPFKAYPKDPLTLTVGVSTTESILGQASNEAYVEFRKQMLRQVAATKARRPQQQTTTSEEQQQQTTPSEEQQQCGPEPLTIGELVESHQQQSSASSGDEEGGGKKRSRTGSESGGPPYSVVKDAAYWERRRKNNEAAKRSRDARRAKEDEIAIRAAFLEQENLKLKYEVAALRHETSNLRCLLYSAANSS